jgi:hypothetical protein
MMVADGIGGMRKIEDHRFEQGEWPISCQIPVEQEQAERWSRYLRWSCHTRGWQWGALGQLDRAENSGTISISDSGKPQLDVVWERKRDHPLKVKARLAASAALTLASAEEFFREVNDGCRSGHTVPLYVRGTLHYEGLAWRGELWLDDNTRLAPPSQQDEAATLGPRIVHVDVMLACIGEPDVPYARHQMLVELSAFLSVVMCRAVQQLAVGRAWAWTPDMKGCEVRYLGYLEPENPVSMPSRGEFSQVPFYPPDNPPLGIVSQNEILVRADIAELWGMYRILSAEKRLQFLQSAAKWQEAMMHWQDRPSLSFALMAVSCEALKPPDADARRNCYDVVEALLGRVALDQIRQNSFPAQDVRSTHLHSGEFHGSELIMMAFMRTYDDPSFQEAHRTMARITPAAIIEWLKRQGEFEFAKVTKPKGSRMIRRFVRENTTLACGLSLVVGVLMGWAGAAILTLPSAVREQCTGC